MEYNSGSNWASDFKLKKFARGIRCLIFIGCLTVQLQMLVIRQVRSHSFDSTQPIMP